MFSRIDSIVAGQGDVIKSPLSERACLVNDRRTVLFLVFDADFLKQHRTVWPRKKRDQSHTTIGCCCFFPKDLPCVRVAEVFLIRLFVFVGIDIGASIE